MFDIGNTLKDARISSGVSIEEASRDLNIKDVILENIENGSIGCFKDIYELKDYISSYAKYLGLSETKLIDQFNEYLFEYTSKIPLKEIEKKMMEQNKEKIEGNIASPYTKPMKKYPKKAYFITYVILIILAILIIIWSIREIIMA